MYHLILKMHFRFNFCFLDFPCLFNEFFERDRRKKGDAKFAQAPGGIGGQFLTNYSIVFEFTIFRRRWKPWKCRFTIELTYLEVEGNAEHGSNVGTVYLQTKIMVYDIFKRI